MHVQGEWAFVESIPAKEQEKGIVGFHLAATGRKKELHASASPSFTHLSYKKQEGHHGTDKALKDTVEVRLYMPEAHVC